MARLLSLLAILLFALTAAVPEAHAQTTDPRDYEGAGGAPDNTVVLLNYLRHTTTQDRRNLTTNLAIFRASWVKKFGNLAIVPIDILMPVADADLRVPAAPGSAVSTASIRSTGFADIQFLPAIIYDVMEDKAERTHTYFGANVYTYIPVGTYNPLAPINLGENRWAVKPQIAIGQRFAKRFTLDLVGNMTVFMDNTDYLAAAKPASEGKPATPAMPHQTLKQDPTWSGELHLGVDVDPTTWLAVSYYATNIGQRSIAATGAEVEAKASVQTMRFTWGWHIEKQMMLLVQFQQDVVATGEASRAHYYGVRMSRFFF